MGFFELLLIGVSVSMDAFSIAICKGLTVREFKPSQAFIVAAYFGIFQGLMPVIGYFTASTFSRYMQAMDHWIALALLAFLGIRMIKEALEPESCPVGDFSVKSMLPLAIATSIDALAVGVTLAILNVNIFYAAGIMAMCTAAFSSIGVIIGSFFGQRIQRPAQIFGGIVLVGLGVKIFAEHMGWLSF